MQQRPVLTAQKRSIFGKKVKQLRKQGQIPASVYGHQFESISLQLPVMETEKLFTHAGESSLVDLKITDGDTYPVLFKNPQRHPVSGHLIHIDLHKVNLKEKITTTVPLEFVGESFAVKAGNVLMQILTEVEVEALPTDLPEKIAVDISPLEAVDQSITIADLKYDKSKVILKNDPEQVVAKIAEPKEEVVEEAPAPAPGDVPATEQKTPEELAAAEAEKKKSKED